MCLKINLSWRTFFRYPISGERDEILSHGETLDVLFAKPQQNIPVKIKAAISSRPRWVNTAENLSASSAGVENCFSPLDQVRQAFGGKNCDLIVMLTSICLLGSWSYLSGQNRARKSRDERICGPSWADCKQISRLFTIFHAAMCRMAAGEEKSRSSGNLLVDSSARSISRAFYRDDLAPKM